MRATTSVDNSSLRRRVAQGAALGVFLAVLASLLAADAWDPLGRESVSRAAWALASVGLGLVVGHAWALGAPLLVVALSVVLPARGEHGEFLSGWSLVPVVGTMLALAGSGLALSRLASTLGDGRRAIRVATVAGGLCLGLAASAAGWGVWRDVRVVDRTPARPILVDERTGAYRGLRIGLPARQVRERFGSPVLGDPTRGAAPLGQDGRELSGGPGPAPGREVWRYRDVVVFIGRGRVLGFAVTDERAQTRRGVGIGDSLAVASRAYGDLYCNRPDAGYRSAVPRYLYCVRDLNPSGYVWFGGDPIDSIWFAID